MMTRLAVDGRQMGTALLVCCALAPAGCGGSTPSDGANSTGVAPIDHLPAGYALRLDRANRDRMNFTATLDDGRLRVGTGPAGILYRPDEVVDGGDYTLRARFTEVGAPMGHREGFGLFIGGQELGGLSQRYVYFLVRGDGIEVTNELAMEAGNGVLQLSCNGEPVAEVTLDEARLHGVVGVRVNHNLSVRIDDFNIEIERN
jgi:hypothetical protein